MNIVMMTNTYVPHRVGWHTRSNGLAKALRQLGHHVLIIAPTFPDMPEDEQDVIRVPAIQQFNGSDFSVLIPIPGLLSGAIDKFQPDLVHAHHPFL